jgi:dTMP kinase
MEKAKPKDRGVFITFEGGDGVGKTTQSALLLEYFQAAGLSAVATREPGGSPVGDDLRALLLNPASNMSPRTEALLYLAARAEHAAGVILPALTAGAHVICDRFSDSTCVYQGVGRGLDAGELARLDSWAAVGLSPDVTFLFDAPPELLLERRRERGGRDRMEKEGLDFQRTVRAGFLALARKYPERILIIDALSDIGDIQAAIRACLADRRLIEGNL